MLVYQRVDPMLNHSWGWFLVGGWALSIWKMMEWKSVGVIIPNIWKKTCSKPPTRFIVSHTTVRCVLRCTDELHWWRSHIRNIWKWILIIILFHGFCFVGVRFFRCLSWSDKNLIVGWNTMANWTNWAPSCSSFPWLSPFSCVASSEHVGNPSCVDPKKIRDTHGVSHSFTIFKQVAEAQISKSQSQDRGKSAKHGLTIWAWLNWQPWDEWTKQYIHYIIVVRLKRFSQQTWLKPEAYPKYTYKKWLNDFLDDSCQYDWLTIGYLGAEVFWFTAKQWKLKV